jgi:hypothetical protein
LDDCLPPRRRSGRSSSSRTTRADGRGGAWRTVEAFTFAGGGGGGALTGTSRVTAIFGAVAAGGGTETANTNLQLGQRT